MDKRIVTLENYKKGEKVIRGIDWEYTDQDKGSVYGIMGDLHAVRGWVSVDWMDENGNRIRRLNYRIGNSDRYDLYFYETEEMFTLDGRKRISS